MNMTRLMGTAALLATTTFAAQSALAYQAGDIYVRGGFEKADPTSDNGDIANQDLDVSEENGFAYGAGYLFHDKFGVELNGSEAMEHDIAVNGGNVGSVDRTPVNLMLNYYPLGGVENARVHPYVGVGMNYTHFSDESFNADLDSSYGAAAQVGLDLSVTDNLLVGTYARYAEVDSDIEVDGHDVGEAEIDPMTIGAGVTYRF
ncbi:OmpW family protein [Halomonas sp. YLB-10]|uniref:OmpW/AlkL family protein n=1 Tax=unclassified Halomonas TaxID=2609666 RepID=UPI000F5EE3A7|nr:MULTISPECIES: OmpW family outer membrane protein [unclassified Halomonas]RQW71236.1 OmpW family protein [Halomonas sp. YLB-10]